MKRSYPFFILVCLAVFVLPAKAQISTGVGLVFATEVESAGLQIRGAYDFDAPFRLNIDLIHYFKDTGIILSDSRTEYNANIQFQAIREEKHSIYLLTGLNLNQPRTTTSIGGTDFSSSTTHVGWNFGLGTQYEVAEQIAVVSELKYIIGEEKQWVMSLGGVYLF